MSNLRFKSCVSCGTKRAWFQERCPQCDARDFTPTVEDGTGLVDDAIGESVNQQPLFSEEVRVLGVSESLPVIGIIIRKVRELLSKVPIGGGDRSPDLTVRILNDPLAEYLAPDEQPHFILTAEVIRREQEDEVSELKPAADFGAARILITNERTRFLIGQAHGDVVRSVAHSAVSNVEFSEGVLSTSVSIETSSTSYRVPDCDPGDEVDPAVAYIRAQAEDSHVNQGHNFNYEKGATKRERIGTVFEDISVTQALGHGSTGAKVGARAGPKGTAVGFVIGVGFGIWADLSQADTAGAEAPAPEDVARNVSEWQQAGGETGNEQAEWLLSSTGAAIAIAAENSDHQSVQELRNVDPAGVANAIQAGSEAMGGPDTLVAQRGTGDIVPDVTNLRRPVTELTSITAELFEQGLFDELIKAQKESEL